MKRRLCNLTNQGFKHDIPDSLLTTRVMLPNEGLLNASITVGSYEHSHDVLVVEVACIAEGGKATI